jgi:hypothetical protein
MLLTFVVAGALAILNPVDSVVYPALRNRGLSDCQPTDTVTPRASDRSKVVCRVRQSYDAAEIISRLGSRSFRRRCARCTVLRRAADRATDRDSC